VEKRDKKSGPAAVTSSRQAANWLLEKRQASDQLEWLTEEFYAEKIQPRLAELRNSAIAPHSW